MYEDTDGGKKGCNQLSSNGTYFFGRWLKGVKTSEEEIYKGVDYCGPVNTIHKVFCLATLERLMEERPVVYHRVMKITPRFHGDVSIMSIGQKCTSWKVLVFIATQGCGSTDPGDPYLSRFPGNYSNVSICPVVFPILPDRYSNACNLIDNHNRICQHNKVLDEDCVSHNGYCRLVTKVSLVIGITYTNLLLCNGIYEKIIDKNVLLR